MPILLAIAGLVVPFPVSAVDDPRVPIALRLPFGLAATGRWRLASWRDTVVPHPAFPWWRQMFGGNALTTTVFLRLGWCGHKCRQNDG